MNRSASLLCLCLAGLSVLSCGDSSRTFVFVSIGATPAAATTVEARVTFSGSPMREATQVLTTHLEGFSVELPAGATGPFAAELGARDASSCLVAQGRGQVAVAGPGRTDLTVTLTALARPACGDGTITVVKKNFGSGTITSDPPGLTCGAVCTASFPKGTSVRILTEPDAQSTLLRYGGACSGAACTVVAGAAQTVEVHLSAAPCDKVRPAQSAICLEQPTLAGAADFNSIWGSSAEDIWAVGDSGAIWHYDGALWSYVPQPRRTYLSSVWGSGPNDVWIVGLGSTVLHWDGQRLSADTLPAAVGGSAALLAVWGSGKDDVWIAGGTILHRDGQTGKWAVKDKDDTGVAVQNTLLALWGSGPSDVWASGLKGVLWHSDGTAWRKVSSPSQADLYSLSGLGPNEIWAAGFGAAAAGQANLLFYGGSQWALRNKPQTGSLPTANYSSIWALGKDAVWTVDTSSNNIWRWSGSFWGQEPLPDLLPRGGALWGDSLSVWLATSGGTLVRRSELNGWKRVGGLAGALFGIWAGDRQVWAVGDYGQVMRRDGQGWSPITQPKGTEPSYYGVWGASNDNLWIVGSGGAIQRWNGSKLAAQPGNPFTTTLHAVTGTSADNVYVAGVGGVIAQWDGTSLKVITTNTAATLFGMAAWSPGEIWAVGASATILRRRTGDATFLKVTAPVGLTANLNAVAALDSTNAWAVGDNATVLRWEGNYWVPMTLPTDLANRVGALHGVAMRAKDDVWVAGTAGSLLHWDGTDWAYARSAGVSAPLYAITVRDGAVWAVGSYGAILRGL